MSAETARALKKQYANYVNAPSNYQSPYPPTCDCNPTPMKRLQSGKDNDNKGKWFYACPKGQWSDDQCDVFLWVSVLSRAGFKRCWCSGFPAKWKYHLWLSFIVIEEQSYIYISHYWNRWHCAWTNTYHPPPSNQPLHPSLLKGTRMEQDLLSSRDC